MFSSKHLRDTFHTVWLKVHKKGVKTHIITLPKRHTKFKPFNLFHRSRRKYQLFVSVAAVYTLIGGLMGYMTITNPTKPPARASTPAQVVASLKFLNAPDGDKRFNLNDKVSIGLTLQNTSSEDSANGLSLELQSTSDALRTINLRSQTDKSFNYTILSNEKNISLPSISSSGQSEYIIDTVLTKNSIDNLNIVSQISYTNQNGNQNGNSNFLTTQISQTKSENESLVFQPMASTFQPKETVKLTLTNPRLKKNSGKIYLANRKNLEPVSSSECDFDGEIHLICEAEFKDLPAGDYSALYMSNDEKAQSDISWFSVTGNQETLIPSEQTILETPFNKSSINGILPIVAKKVINLNQLANSSLPCIFDIYFNDKKVSSSTAAVNEDRNCQTILDASQLSQGNGIYKIKLAKSEMSLDISFTEKSKTLFSSSISGNIIRNKPVNIEVRGLNDTENKPLNGKKATLGLWHTLTNSFQELTSINNQFLSVSEGGMSFSIPYSYLDKGGVYQSIIKLEDGSQSEWLPINLSDKSVAFARENIKVEGTKAGEAMSLSIGSLVDKDNNQVTSGDCAVSVYTGTITPVLATGSIDKGVCKTSIKAGRLTKSGSALVSFSAPEIPTSINQSKQIIISPNSPTTFGGINLSTFPAQALTANSLIIGPVTDSFDNLTDGFGYTLELYRDDQLIKTFGDISVDHGYAQIVIPASMIDGQKLTARLMKNEAELQRVDFPVTSESQTFVLPPLPSSINSDKSIQIETKQNTFIENTQCKIRLIRSLGKNNELADDLRSDSRSCSFDWDLLENRDSSQLLMQFIIGNQMTSKIVNQKSGNANNLFVLTPQLRFTQNNDIDMTLLTSPLLDRQGLPVESSTLKWKYNGKLRDSQISNGMSSISVLANNLTTRDIQTNNNQRFLNLDFDVKASSSSINRTNNLNIFLGTNDINNHKDEFGVVSAQNIITQDSTSISTIKYTVDPANIEEETQTVESNIINLPHIFAFKSSNCTARDTDAGLSSFTLKSHYQGGFCYVQTSSELGKHTLSLQENNFTLLTHQYTVASKLPKVSICENESGSCLIQVDGDQTSPITSVITDGDREYQDESKGAENNMTISHKDLNPLKKYLIKVSFTIKDNQKVEIYREFIGSALAK